MKLWFHVQILLVLIVPATFEEVLTQISEERYTRYPVYEGDRDNILGFLNIKDFLTLGMNNRIQS